MFRRPLVLLVVSLALVTGCHRTARLDQGRKMVYSVKPAVVRISAYATAQFRYPAAAINNVANEIAHGREGLAAPRDLPAGDGLIQTGAGGSGSGFIVHPSGFILTSGHVVAPTRDRASLDRELRRNGAIAALVKHFPVDELRAIYRTDGLERYIGEIATAGSVEKTAIVNTVELSNGETLPFTTRVYSPDLSARGTDVALLKVQRNNLPVLHLGDSDTVRVGDSVLSVGYPAVASSSDEVIGGWLSRDSDLEATSNPGMITAIKRNVANIPVLQSNVAIYPGNSGGPAVDRDGDVVAISTWGHSEAEQIKFLVPINVARDLLNKAGVPINVDGEFNRRYRQALDAAADGEWPVARKELSAAAAFFPKSPDVRPIRQRHRPGSEEPAGVDASPRGHDRNGDRCGGCAGVRPVCRDPQEPHSARPDERKDGRDDRLAGPRRSARVGAASSRPFHDSQRCPRGRAPRARWLGHPHRPRAHDL